MPSRSSSSLRRAIGLAAALVVCVAVVIGGRLAFLAAAHGILDHWEEAGLPGHSPRGQGPAVDLHWPPRLLWTDLAWNGGGDPDGTIRLSCKRLEVRVLPWTLLTGRLHIESVEAQDVRVEVGESISRWTEPLLASMKPMGVGETPVRPDPQAVPIEIRSVVIGPGSRTLASIRGWAWEPDRAGWAFVARVTGAASEAMTVRGSGAGAAGAGDAILDAELGPDRSLHLDLRRPLGGSRSWELSGRDDGSLLSELLPSAVSAGTAVHGRLQFWMSRSTGTGLDGEVQAQELTASFDRDEPWTIQGSLCLGKGMATLQDVVLDRGPTHLNVAADLPIGGAAGTGRCAVQGTWEGEPVRVEGIVRHEPGGWRLSCPHLEKGACETGAVEVTWDGRPGGVRATIGLGTGSLALDGGAGTDADPARLHAIAIPVSQLERWLPFRLPGEWTGTVDGRASVRRRSGQWLSSGMASLADGRVRRLPLLDALGEIWNGADRGALRLSRADTRWAYASGRFLADSLTLESSSLVLRGTVFYAPPDSLLGLINVSPKTDGSAGALLRLLGADEGGLDVGLSGRASRPDILPLDSGSLARWRDRIEARRRALPASRSG